MMCSFIFCFGFGIRSTYTLPLTYTILLLIGILLYSPLIYFDRFYHLYKLTLGFSRVSLVIFVFQYPHQNNFIVKFTLERDLNFLTTFSRIMLNRISKIILPYFSPANIRNGFDSFQLKHNNCLTRIISFSVPG